MLDEPCRIRQSGQQILIRPNVHLTYSVRERIAVSQNANQMCDSPAGSIATRVDADHYSHGFFFFASGAVTRPQTSLEVSSPYRQGVLPSELQYLRGHFLVTTFVP